MNVWKRSVRRSTIVLAAACSVLLGLVVARFHVTVPLWFVLVMGVASLFAVRTSTRLTLIIVSICLFSFGLYRGGIYVQELQPYAINNGKRVTLHAVAATDAIYAPGGQLSFTVDHVRFMEPQGGSVPGSMKIKGYGELAVYKGDKLQITGKLYKTRGASQGSVSYAQLTRTGSHNSFIDTMRRTFAAGVQTALPEPLASFALGLLVGQRNTLPHEYTQALMMVGLTHIIAVSGYNLTILLEATKRLVGGRSKQLSVLAGFALMGIFVMMTGGAASIVRAAIVSTLSLGAWYYGRSIRPLVLILLAAALTAGYNPIYLWSDIGWYLSFLAFFGILMIAPKILQYWYGAARPPLLLQVAVETLSAELMTLPLILYIFGQMSYVGLIANVLVVTFIPFAMLASLIAGLAGMFIPFLSGVFAYPAKLVLTYMLDTAVALSRIPHIFRSNTYITMWDMVVTYSTIAAIVALLHKKRSTWFAGIHMPQKRNR